MILAVKMILGCKHLFTIFSFLTYANIYVHMHVYTQKLMTEILIQYNIYQVMGKLNVFSVTSYTSGKIRRELGEKAINNPVTIY